MNRVPLFCDSALAERIERVEAQLMAACTEAALRRNDTAGSFHIAFAGGVASFAETGSPFNKVAGLGFGGVPTAAALDKIERAFAACGCPVQVELAHLADPAIGILLSERGYRLESFENVLGLALDGEFERFHPDGIEIRRSGDEEFEAWLTVVADGVAYPDTQGVPWHEEFPRDMYIAAERDLAAAGVIRYVAVRDGAFAGGAGLRLAEGIAQFAGAATAPAHRRRGIQSALLSARLVDAAEAGCSIAVITTQPGSTSQQNAQRRGFDLLYTRAVLVKQT
jgi:GNAT superfamily N-acetyltransferase